MTGYLSNLYAESLSFHGSPRYLSHSGGYVLERNIGEDRDAMGLYPIFCCRWWDLLSLDIEEMESLISLVVVTNPLGNYNDSILGKCFDFARPYKSHHIVDLENVTISTHHRRNVDRAMEKVKVEVASSPSDWADDWVSLYGHLIERHKIEGIAAFPPDSLRKQLEVPGTVAIRTILPETGEPVCMLIWYVMGDVAYYHLGASSPEGYELRASYAAFWGSIAYFDGLRYLSLGAGAGVNESDDGLDRFKRGWANGTRQAYLCGKILDRERYDELADGKVGSFFPIYRRWE